MCTKRFIFLMALAALGRDAKDALADFPAALEIERTIASHARFHIDPKSGAFSDLYQFVQCLLDVFRTNSTADATERVIGHHRRKALWPHPFTKRHVIKPVHTSGLGWEFIVATLENPPYRMDIRITAHGSHDVFVSPFATVIDLDS